MIYVTSDTHFEHKRIAQYCNRPADHEERMWAGLEALKAEDTLVHLGDFSFGNWEVLKRNFERIPCERKFLVEGNHDVRSRKRLKRLPWVNYFPLPRRENAPHLTQYCFYDEWRFITARHFPFPEQMALHAEIALTGHVHDRGQRFRWKNNVLHVCACVELWDYKPIPLDLIRSEYDRAAGFGFVDQPAEVVIENTGTSRSLFQAVESGLRASFANSVLRGDGRGLPIITGISNR